MSERVIVRLGESGLWRSNRTWTVEKRSVYVPELGGDYERKGEGRRSKRAVKKEVSGWVVHEANEGVIKCLQPSVGRTHHFKNNNK